MSVEVLVKNRFHSWELIGVFDSIPAARAVADEIGDGVRICFTTVDKEFMLGLILRTK